MKTTRTTRPRIRTGLIATAAALTLFAAACGDDDDGDAGAAAPPTEAMTTEPAEPMTTEPGEPMTTDMATPDPTEPMTDSPMGSPMAPSGPACSSVPDDGEGSFAGMADDPAATAASNNPELSTLVTAVQEAGLVDTLNGDGPFTIFAPANSAFAAIPADDLEALLADPQGALTDILTLHVVAGERLSSTDLAEDGSVTALAGELTIEAGDTVTVDAGGGPATVICADIPTANATVHIIDTVLLPSP